MPGLICRDAQSIPGPMDSRADKKTVSPLR